MTTPLTELELGEDRLFGQDLSPKIVPMEQLRDQIDIGAIQYIEVDPPTYINYHFVSLLRQFRQLGQPIAVSCSSVNSPGGG